MRKSLSICIIMVLASAAMSGCGIVGNVEALPLHAAEALRQADSASRTTAHQAGAAHSPSAHDASGIRGVVEGFYGKPWSNQERRNMFSFMERENLNTYVYAPKGDPYQRVDWRLPYPKAQLNRMKVLVKEARQNHVAFVYSISPGMTGTSTMAVNKSITYSSASDRKLLQAKINQLRSIGVNTFMLSFDDIQTSLKHADQTAYGSNYGEAQAQLANEIEQAELKKDPHFQLWFVPTQYYGLVDSPYWQTLRSTLNPKIKAVWTGRWVLNKTISSNQAKTVERLLGRRPILWDNYPVNDYTYDSGRQPALMMGPLQGRSASLPSSIAGYLSNPMIQPYASQLALETIAQYLQHPTQYHPKRAWESALKHLPGITNPALFQEFAEFNSASTLDPQGYSPINNMVKAYENAPSIPQKRAAEQALRKEFRMLAALPHTLPPTIKNKALLHEIEPWLTKLGHEGRGGLDALAVIQSSTGPNRERLAQQLNRVRESRYKIGENIIAFMESVAQH